MVCYLNQFFGQIGGETRPASGRCSRRRGSRARRPAAPRRRGPRRRDRGRGRQLRRGACRCGVAEMLDLIAAESGFRRGSASAGRYGVAWRPLRTCRTLRCPPVTGMHQENPGVELYRRRVIVRPVATRGSMLDEVRRLVALGLKLARRSPSAARSGSGYFPRGSPQYPRRRHRRAARQWRCCSTSLAAPSPARCRCPTSPHLGPPAVRDLTPSSPSSRTAGSSRSAIRSDRGLAATALRRVHRGPRRARPRAVRQRPSRL